MKHPEGTKAARITALAQQFHAIAEYPAVVNSDANALDEWAQVASHGEKLAA